MFKVIEQSDRILHFRYQRPVLFGSFFVCIAVLILFIGARTVEFQLSRTAEDRVDGHVRTSWYGLFPRERTIQGITGAYVEEHRSQKGRRTYRLVLETRARDEPLTATSDSDRSDKEELRRTVERFVASADRGPQREVDSPSFLITSLVLICLGSGVLIVMLGGGEVRLDRDADRVELRRRQPFGAGTQEYRLSDVREFAVRSSHSGRSKSATYGAVMCLKDGEEVALRRIKTSGFAKKQELVQRLEAFRVRVAAAHPAPAGPSAPRSDGAAAPVVCGICGWDCANAERFEDADGRCYHKECYDWQQRGGKDA